MAKGKLNWITKRKKTMPEVPYQTPIWLGNMSNGEYFLPKGERERKLQETILAKCDENARKKGMDRREFIASTMGMATTLSVLNLAAGCGDKDGMMNPDTLDKLMSGRGAIDKGAAAAPATGAGGSKAPRPGGGTDGGFVVTPELCLNEAMADRLFKGDYFILDFQTHHTRDGMSGLCLTGDNTPACTSPDTYIRQIFEESETTVAVLSGLPSAIDEASGDLSPFSFTNEDMRNSRDRVNRVAHANDLAAERMVAHCQISPKAKPEANAKMMAENKRQYDTRGWKCYPPTEGGWFLHENDAFIKTAIELDEPLVCAHKGFPFQGWSRVHADPMPDVAVVAKRYPEVKFIIYHSAYDSAHMEGPYDPNPSPTDGGTDRLSKVVSENDLTGKNVYAEMGSAWAISMRDPVVAQHYVGKMLKYIGIDRLVWGSECVWYGSPQNQIEAFKAFRISTEFQDMYGYPEFTDELRRNVFGLIGAEIYRVKPSACRYKVDRSQFAEYKKAMDDRWGPRRHAINPPVIRTKRDYIELWKDRLARGEIA
ncbi:MAG TPA: amidohydrolase family protein [Polyangiales bacterium]|nr:amidohydrolase family protein [Polyangiales bacterium]